MDLHHDPIFSFLQLGLYSLFVLPQKADRFRMCFHIRVESTYVVHNTFCGSKRVCNEILHSTFVNCLAKSVDNLHMLSPKQRLQKMPNFDYKDFYLQEGKDAFSAGKWTDKCAVNHINASSFAIFHIC